jgi:hypothetical protein
MTNMNTGKFIDVVDHASRMNDRWLFLAAFCLLIVGCGLVIYWLVKQLQALIADHKALQARHHDSLAEIVITQNETTLKLAVCIDRNTTALQECAFELRRFQERKET